ncbi:MAG: prolipoprotein diacylglyceryl transferase [Phycisphaerae bacterium]|nr:prolipoprotein diacylglyceryl transferase [Saprospiraceae bacterium]
MHYPLEIHLGSAKIPAHLLFEMLAYTLGYRLYVWQRARSQDLINDEGRMWIFLGAAAGALMGSHLLGILENPAYLTQLNWQIWLGNKTIVGGLLGGLIGVELTKKIISVNTSSGDLMTYPLLFGLAVGRIGCHLAGLTDGTHGNPSNLPWAVDFGDGIPRHPVNLYEVIFLLALAFFIFHKEKKGPLPDGIRFKIFMVGYLLWRFVVEFIKPVWVLPIGISVIQLATLCGLFYYKGVWWPKMNVINRKTGT